MDRKSISRRAALRKLGFGVLAAYVVPEILAVSTAAASSEPTLVSEPTSPISEPTTPVSVPTTPTDPEASGASTPEASLPSGPSDADWRDDDTCSVHTSRSNQVTINNSDFRRAQRAVANGEALPLSEVFQSVQENVSGKLIEVRFSNAGVPPIYQFRMVSARGKLITVFADASSAEILRIVSC